MWLCTTAPNSHAGIVGIWGRHLIAMLAVWLCGAPPNSLTAIMGIGACLIAMLAVWLLYVRTALADTHAGCVVIVRAYSGGLFLFAIPLFRYHRRRAGGGPTKNEFF